MSLEKRKGYDEKCYEIASAFLADDSEINDADHRDELAQHIQDEIESTIQSMRARRGEPGHVCGVCGKEYGNAEELVAHWKDLHDTRKPLPAGG